MALKILLVDKLLRISCRPGLNLNLLTSSAETQLTGIALEKNKSRQTISLLLVPISRSDAVVLPAGTKSLKQTRKKFHVPAPVKEGNSKGRVVAVECI
jgi:hypothetical protein